MPIVEQTNTSPVAAPHAGVPKTAPELIDGIRSDDADVRTAAWRSAGAVGADAVMPLVMLAVHEPMEVARAAERALWQIVRYCGRPGADAERQAVQAALVGQLVDIHPAQFRRNIVWMLSEIGGDDCIASLAALLSHDELREDARMAIERIPGDASLHALTTAVETAPEDFKPNIAESLRRRGIILRDIPSAKLTPVKPTEVKPI